MALLTQQLSNPSNELSVNLDGSDRNKIPRANEIRPTRQLIEPDGFHPDVPKFELANDLPEKRGFSTLGLDQRQVALGTDESHGNGRGAASRTQVEPLIVSTCGRQKGSREQRLDQEFVDRVPGRRIQRKTGQANRLVPTSQQMKVLLETKLDIWQD